MSRKQKQHKREGWYRVASVTRVFYDPYLGIPTCVATLSPNLDAAADSANDAAGRILELDTWFCADDSPHAALVGDTWGALDWSGDWMLAGVKS
jgi:hypothetical protein